MPSPSHAYERTTLIAFWLASFLAGLGLARTRIYLNIYLCAVVALLCLLLFRLRLPVLAMVIIGVSFGLWRGGSFLTLLSKYDYIYKRQVTITGIAQTDAVYAERSQLSFDMGDIHLDGQELVGKVSIKGYGENMVYKGDAVQVAGKPYQTKGSKQAGISYAEIRVVSRSSSVVERLRRRFETGMQSALPEPAASFGLGLLIGQRTTIPKNVSQQLSAVGLTHVVAVSGYNLTIIMSAVRKLLKKRSKYQNTIFSLVLVGLFLLFTGFSASIVRAALVSLLSLWAWYYGRSFRPMVLILLAAAITAGVYPIYIWSDIGWYLSFLAFYGVLVVGPGLTKRIFGNKTPKLLAGVIIETISAQVMTVPIIMYIFGQFSVIALVANLLVVPLVSLGMLFCMFAGIGGMLVPGLAGWFALPARVLLTYMLDIVAALAKLPKAFIEQPLSLFQMIFVYAAILLVVAVLWQTNRGRGDIIRTV